MKHSTLLLAAAIGLAVRPLHADPAPAAVESARAPTKWFDQETMTGDWFGVRTALADRGLTWRVSQAGFFQYQPTFENETAWSGKLDAYFDWELEKLGFWKGGSVHGHLEFRTGEVFNFFQGGILFPTNSAAVMPGSAGDIRLEASITSR